MKDLYTTAWKTSLLVLASTLAAFGAQMLMTADELTDVAKAAVALGFAAAVFAVRELTKKYDQPEEPEE